MSIFDSQFEDYFPDRPDLRRLAGIDRATRQAAERDGYALDDDGFIDDAGEAGRRAQYARHQMDKTEEARKDAERDPELDLARAVMRNVLHSKTISFDADFLARADIVWHESRSIKPFSGMSADELYADVEFVNRIFRIAGNMFERAANA
jgi:hypothetical protein